MAPKTQEHKSLRYADLLGFSAVISTVAGVVHLMVSPYYLQEWWGYGFFFILAGLAQVTYGMVLGLLPWLAADAPAFLVGERARARMLYHLGTGGNLAIIALYIVTRTLGVPAGPELGTALPITPLSLGTTLTELLLVIALLRLGYVARRAIALH
jgi:manganese oxidase